MKRKLFYGVITYRKENTMYHHFGSGLCLDKKAFLKLLRQNADNEAYEGEVINLIGVEIDAKVIRDAFNELGEE